MIYIRFIFLFLVFVQFLFTSCNQSKKEEGIISGETDIIVDESIFTIVDDQAEIFALNYKQAKINFIYKPEADLLKLFLSDSIKTAITARNLLPEEKRHFENQNIVVRTNRFAIDAIALIANPSFGDSSISIKQFNDAVHGKGLNNVNFVFDNPKSSTVAYLMNRFDVKKLPANFYSLKSNVDVVKYIANNKGAIGLISLSWLVRAPKELEQYTNQIKLLGVRDVKDISWKPNQSTLKTNDYPLTRGLYIINCQGSAGLGTGFASFLAGELGQRIVLKSGLAPDSLPTRLLNIK